TKIAQREKKEAFPAKETNIEVEIKTEVPLTNRFLTPSHLAYITWKEKYVLETEKIISLIHERGPINIDNFELSMAPSEKKFYHQLEDYLEMLEDYFETMEGTPEFVQVYATQLEAIKEVLTEEDKEYLFESYYIDVNVEAELD